MSRRIKDDYNRNNSIAEIEDLYTIAENNKDKVEDRRRLLKKEIADLAKMISITREEFISFLNAHGVDTAFPVFSTVTADSVMPFTVSGQALTEVPIENAMLPNNPNPTFLRTLNLLQNKYETLQDEIEEYVYSLLRMRLRKSELEADLESVDKTITEYKGRLEEYKTEYDAAVSNLNKLRSLYQNLLDFKYLLTAVPDTFTAESYTKFQNNYFNRYSTEYYNKKKTIMKMGITLQDSYELTVFDKDQLGIYTSVFREISYFFSSDEGYSIEESNNSSDDTIKVLPEKYVDAIPYKTFILKKLDLLAKDIDELISNSKMTLDAIRGVKGVGNSVVDSLITSTNAIANSYASKKTIIPDTLKDIKNDNYTVRLGINQSIDNFKSHLQLGVENLDAKFVRASSHFLRKMAKTIGFPVTFFYDRTINLEDHLREKVRQKYGGNIPFCDEVESTDEYGNKIFIKKDDVDPKTGKSKTNTQALALGKLTEAPTDILSA